MCPGYWLHGFVRQAKNYRTPLPNEGIYGNQERPRHMDTSTTNACDKKIHVDKITWVVVVGLGWRIGSFAPTTILPQP